MTKHAVVRTDKMYATDNRAGLVSIKYIVDGEPAEIENGNVLKIGALMEGEREIYEGSAPAADDEYEDVVLVASPEVMYDERLKNLDDFINVAEKPARGYILHNKDIFSVTKEALDDLVDSEESPAVGKQVAFQGTTKLKVVDEDGIGTIIHKEVAGRYTYYAIQIGLVTGATGATGATGDTGANGTT